MEFQGIQEEPRADTCSEPYHDRVPIHQVDIFVTLRRLGASTVWLTLEIPGLVPHADKFPEIRHGPRGIRRTARILIDEAACYSKNVESFHLHLGNALLRLRNLPDRVGAGKKYRRALMQVKRVLGLKLPAGRCGRIFPRCCGSYDAGDRWSNKLVQG